MACEIERKYLIAMPDEAMLRGADGAAVWEIEQIYLSSLPGQTRRVRRVVENGVTTYYRTFKTRISDLTAEEDEGTIDAALYNAYLTEADPALKPILKTRYRVPYMDQLLEIDIYPFWSDRAILEIELDSEDRQTFIPDTLHVIREVTHDRRYKNVRLAYEIPMDEI